LAGVVGGCLGIEPISAGGDSVIRITGLNVSETVSFPSGEGIQEIVSETVTVLVT